MRLLFPEIEGRQDIPTYLSPFDIMISFSIFFWMRAPVVCIQISGLSFDKAVFYFLGSLLLVFQSQPHDSRPGIFRLPLKKEQFIQNSLLLFVIGAKTNLFAHPFSQIVLSTLEYQWFGVTQYFDFYRTFFVFPQFSFDRDTLILTKLRLCFHSSN